MMISERVLKPYGFSYLPMNRILAIFCLLATVLLVGCDSRQTGDGLGAIAGVTQLSDPDPGTGHAGVLVYLAGTSFQARSDQQGRYRIDGITAGTYDLIAEKPGYQGQIIEDLLIIPETHSHETPLRPATTLLVREEPTTSPLTGASELGSIRGTVLLDGMPDENGGVRVEVDGTAFVTVSGNDGQYRILNVKPGQYHLSFHREGYLPYTMAQSVEVTSGVTVMEDVALELVQPGDPVSAAAVAASVAARAVTPENMEPLPGPETVRTIVGIVEVRDESGKIVNDYSNVTVAINGTNRIAEINDQGQFRFDDLTSGTYTLVGTVPGGPIVRIPVDLATQRVASISVRLLKGQGYDQAGGTIRGRVVLVDLDDEPLKDSGGVKVAVNGTQVIATSAADGAFTLTGIAPGTYTVSATKEDFVPGEAAGVNVTAAAPVDVGEIRMMLDVERPRVLSTIPADNERDILVGFNLPIVVKFSDRMDGVSVRNAISLKPATPYTAYIGSGAGFGADDDTLIINLSNESAENPIMFGTQYRVSIAETAANLGGITMAEPYNFSFRTAKPGVIEVSPQNGADDVWVNQLDNPVLFSFNTRLDPDTINDRNIRVRPDNGVSVSVTHTNSPDKGWTTIRVATRWEPDTQYTVTVSRRVKASNGQSLGNTPFTLRFRTAEIDIRSMPIIEIR